MRRVKRSLNVPTLLKADFHADFRHRMFAARQQPLGAIEPGLDP